MWILVCEYLRESGKFNISYKELKKAQRWWTREKVTERSITQTIADICSFISHKCVHVGAKFFNEEGELAYGEKYENIKNWTTKLHLRDYKLPHLF